MGGVSLSVDIQDPSGHFSVQPAVGNWHGIELGELHRSHLSPTILWFKSVHNSLNGYELNLTHVLYNSGKALEFESRFQSVFETLYQAC